VKRIRGKKRPLSAPGLHVLRDAYPRTIDPARALATVQVSVLPSDTSISRRFAMGCNKRGFKPDGLELRSVTSPFQPPRVWDAHY
jgi:hypothetical protein